MARRKRKQDSMLWGVLGAVIVGLVIGAIVYNPMEQAPPPPPDVSYDGPYDDEWGKLATPVARVEATHVLISWAGAGVNTIKDADRTEEEAKALIEEIWYKYRNEPSEANWRKLQAEYNEDSADVHNVYTIPAPPGEPDLVPEFKEVAKSTKVGHARIAKTAFGYHLIRRE